MMWGGLNQTSSKYAAMALCAALAFTSIAQAGDPSPTNVVLGDRNSSVSFCLVDCNSSGSGGEGALIDEGHNSWYVDGVNQLRREWFWIRPGSGPEQSLGSLFFDGFQATDTNPFSDSSLDTLGVMYGDGPMGQRRYEVELSFQLRGGNAGSMTSDLGETIRIKNVSTGAPITFNFFQYVDFDLDGTALGDTARIQGAGNNVAYQTGEAVQVSENVVHPDPSHWEAANFPATLGKLTDGDADDLSDANGPVFGDVTWAFQWTFTLEPGQSYTITKDKNIAKIPEPATLALLALGAAALRRRMA